MPPFYCDYGSNVGLGANVFFNFNCVLLDVCAVEIGEETQFGPAVQIYTATYPLNAALRPTAGVRPADPMALTSGWAAVRSSVRA